MMDQGSEPLIEVVGLKNYFGDQHVHDQLGGRIAFQLRLLCEKQFAQLFN